MIKQDSPDSKSKEKETQLKEPKECKHNWVMDGHNAGDPICSKCYKRE
jgi:hypothetical protein